MKIIPVLILLVVLSGCSSLSTIDRELEKHSTSIQLLHNSLIIADWLQTREISVNPNFVELNKDLGLHPTLPEVNRFFLREIALQNAAPLILPKKWRKYWHTYGSVYRYDFVKNNHQLGIDFKF